GRSAAAPRRRRNSAACGGRRQPWTPPSLIPPRYDRRANRSWTGGTPAPHRGRHGAPPKGGIMPKELLIKGGHVVTVDPDLGDLPAGDVLVTDGLITAVGP